jgi:S-adenosylmethionine-dependent methyltransferase
MLAGFDADETKKDLIRRFVGRRAPARLRRRFRQLDEERLAKLEASIARYYAGADVESFLNTQAGKKSVHEVLQRIRLAREDVIPWIERYVSLDGARVLEIGCGTGADVVALAEQGANVIAMDIDEGALTVARDQCSAYAVEATILLGNAIEAGRMFGNEKFDLVILFACLEHMTPEERAVVMRETWDLVPTGKLWCVIETPNRLWWYDSHSAQLPFFNWLPDELALRYSEFSEREWFRGLQQGGNTDKSMLKMRRAGRGVSFHEFDLYIKPAAQLHVVGDKEIFYRQRNLLSFLRWLIRRNDRKCESLLRSMRPDLHPAFFQAYLNLLIRKDT